MLAIYDLFPNSWFGRQNHRRDSQKNFMTLKVHRGIPEAFSEAC